MTRTCVTHHYACDCREAEFTELRGMAECMAHLQDELVRAGIIGAEVPPMFYPEAIAKIAMERDALRAKIDGARVVKATRNGVVRTDPGFSDAHKRFALVGLDETNTEATK